jgi:hypothetical protein
MTATVTAYPVRSSLASQLRHTHKAVVRWALPKAGRMNILGVKAVDRRSTERPACLKAGQREQSRG